MLIRLRKSNSGIKNTNGEVDFGRGFKSLFFCEIRRLESGNNILRHNCGVILILVYVIEDSDV